MQNLDEAVLERLITLGADDHVVDLVLAALSGPDALDAHLESGTEPPWPDATTARTSPEGTYLTNLSIEGFHGIGARTQLRPTPGSDRSSPVEVTALTHSVCG